MKVLYLSYNGLLEPIAPSQVVPYLRGLARKGYDILLLTFEKRGALKKTGRATIKRMRDELRSAGIEWRFLIYHKSPRLLATLYDLTVGSTYILYLILSRSIRIVHIRGITPGSMMLLIGKFVNVRILFDMRGLLAEEIAAGGGWREGGLAFQLVKKCEKALLRRADAISVLTNKHLERNRDLDILKSRTLPMDVIPCCVDLGKFNYDDKAVSDSRRKLTLDESAFVLMYQGKLGTFYFMDEMVDFFKAMLTMRKDAKFVIITNDPVEPVLKRCAAIGIDEKAVLSVIGAGFDDMPGYLKMADAGIFFINPRNKMGSSPIKMGEFLASGVPVIINPGIGDTEELVRANRVGVVVNGFTDDPYRIALDELFLLKREGDALRKRCRETAREYLSLEGGIERYAALYEKLSGDPR